MEKKEAELGNSFLAIVGGAATTFLTGLILFPVVQLIADEFWEFDLFGEKKGMSANDIIFYGSMLLWIFLAAIAGGIICSLICKSYEYTHAIILTGIFLALLLFSIIGSEERPDLLIKFITLIVVGAGFLSGTRIGIMKKKRRKDKQSLNL
jgi:hypothetical protein